MSRPTRAADEKPLVWIASSLSDLLDFPEEVQRKIGAALSVAQFGGKHPSAKPWKGIGPGVFEIVDDFRSDAYRAVYTVRFADVVYVLHAFQKKSPSGIRTPRRDVELVAQRLKQVQGEFEGSHGQ
jgi:phage-related protein